ncbi:major royal jelly protein-domain-containing protein [Amylocystis lapponica]|nr:major royal jelly protein-domain-containing protein [Amylocystis lapponica]
MRRCDGTPSQDALFAGPFMLCAVGALAQSNSSVFDFPDYPPPGTPNPNATLGNAAAPLPYGVTNSALSDAYIHFDTGYFGTQIELVHAYYNYWPTGVGVASTGEIFTCFPRGNETYTLAILDSPTTESAWPELEHPEAFQNASNPGFSIATEKFLWVQSVVVDGLDRVWALDTGRPRVNGSVLLAQAPGGPKLVGFYLNGTRFVTYTFPEYVAYPDSSLNDIRFDLRGTGYAFFSDNSPVRPGIVVLDLATGESWRHLDLHPAVSVDPSFVPIYNGVPLYDYPIGPPNAITNFNVYAADGIALSADGTYLYLTPLSSRSLWRVPTALLKVQPSSQNPYAYMRARQAVELVSEMGSHADGMETDASGYIYIGAQEHNGVNRYNPATGLIEPFIRDPHIQWPDTFSTVSLQEGNYLYFTSNQLWLGPDFQNGTDLRTKPYALFRVPIEAGRATQTE